MVLINVKNYFSSLVVVALLAGIFSCERKSFDPVKINEKEKRSKLVGGDSAHQNGSLNQKMRGPRFNQTLKRSKMLFQKFAVIHGSAVQGGLCRSSACLPFHFLMEQAIRTALDVQPRPATLHVAILHV